MLSVHVRPTLRERNEREGTPSSEFEAALGFSGAEIAEQAPGCRSVPLSASRHWISVRKLFSYGRQANSCSRQQPFLEQSRSHGRKDDD
jgi:hypothetical protein